jgi:large subunit ribosomal protein L6
MSRIGSQPVPVSKGVEVSISGTNVKVKGPKGSLEYNFNADFVDVSYSDADKNIVIARKGETSECKAQHGLCRSLIDNMVKGVAEGWTKELEIRGTGYRGALQGSTLNLNLGYSHPINYAIPQGITITMPENTKITITGADKQLVGQVAADIRFFRRPEPYKGKGIRYVGEHIALKEGKSAGKK